MGPARAGRTLLGGHPHPASPPLIVGRAGTSVSLTNVSQASLDSHTATTSQRGRRRPRDPAGEHHLSTERNDGRAQPNTGAVVVECPGWAVTECGRMPLGVDNRAERYGQHVALGAGCRPAERGRRMSMCAADPVMGGTRYEPSGSCLDRGRRSSRHGRRVLVGQPASALKFCP